MERWKELGALEGGAVAWEAEGSSDGRAVRLNGISFQSGDCAFRVIDNPPRNAVSSQSALAAELHVRRDQTAAIFMTTSRRWDWSCRRKNPAPLSSAPNS